MSLRIEHVRLTIKEGAKDRFLTCLALNPPSERTEMGQLFALVEITRKWFPTTQIGQSIVGMLSRSYYKGASTSDLENFEQAINQVNRLLANLTQQGETEWIGHLNSSLALINDSNIHIATTGEMPVWLGRDKHLTMITDPAATQETSPLKTFGIITSGSLLPNDWLFIGSAKLFEYLPKSSLINWFTGDNAYQTGFNIASFLRKHHLKEAIGLIITAQQSDQSEKSNHPSVIYIDQPLESTTAKIKRLSLTITQKIRYGLTKIAAGFDLASQQIRPRIIKTVSQSQPITRKLIKRFQAALSKAHRLVFKLKADQSSPTLANKSIISQGEQAEDRVITAKETMIGKTIFTINDYRAVNQSAYHQSTKKFQNILKGIAALPRRLRLIGKHPTRSLLPLVGAIFLGIFLIASIAWQKNRTIKRQEIQKYDQLVQESAKRLEDGKNALIFNNRKEAQLAFAQAIEKAKNLPSVNRDQSRAKNIIDEAQKQLDSLTGTTRLRDLKPIVTGDALAYAVVHDGQLIIVSDHNPTINEYSPVDSMPTPLATLSNPPRPIRPPNTDSLLYLLTQTTIEQVNLTNKQITVFNHPQSKNFDNVVDLGVFGSNLYLLEPSQNRISKYPLGKESLGQPTSYLKKGDVKNALSMTIDGAVYVLTADGQVTKYSRGEKQEFSISDIPKPNSTIKKPLQIDTSEATPSIFVVDANPEEPRILEFDKNAKYLHQFVLPSNQGKLKSVFYQLKSRKAWVVLGDGVYEINL